MKKQKITTIIICTFAFLIFVACGLLADKAIKEKNAENIEATTGITTEIFEEETTADINEENKEDALKYLKEKYNREFKIIESEEPSVWNLWMVKDENVLSMYMAAPVDEEELTFTVYKIKKYDTKEVMFKDTYFEATKDYVMKKYIDPEGYFVIGNTTPDQVAQQVYTLMSRINNELETYGIETNENTCSVTLKFTLGDYVEEISFYEYDFDTIYGQVELALFGGDMYNN